MKALGHDVAGSDRTSSALTKDLESQGIRVAFLQDGSGIVPSTDLFVYSEAIPETSPERMKARELNIRQVSYFAAVGELTKGKPVIAICGTHGKSSTTAMVARMLTELGEDPNVIVGTKLREFNGRNWRAGRGKWWVVEACEYRRSFHYLSPTIVLLTNADGDHFDAFGSLDDYHQAFVDFLKLLPPDGKVIVHGGDAQAKAIVVAATRESIDADQEPHISLQTPGKHMQENAQLALALAKHLKLDEAKAQKALSGYAGSWRRMEVKGILSNGVTVIDDYGHHPTEIRATLNAIANAYNGRRIICVYQPHTHDRTLKLWNDFTKAFTDANTVVLCDVYDARPDTERELADVDKLARAIEHESKVHCRAIHGTLENVKEVLLSSIVQPNDVLLVMGAGTITSLASSVAESRR